jgi:hypothetical protein
MTLPGTKRWPFGKRVATSTTKATISVGEQLEAGWAKRGKGSSFRRNIEVWRFGFTGVLKVFVFNYLKVVLTN